ncbi:uncharacterized protein LY89DRAFT_729689 [Mollisia scopiformis]|uniref:Myb-like domain-containing protein n=1 Tax=Mollisia scopiformis TaxID=149040 RepID=A0A194XL14_MOLSC|nr:uncharacterized protein LY89DRAFT_729689 [Mollisia scopiformis]KUJ20868.1 hypothetical protein LY89DRAFT_729689 [Mollisia scopiformis]
MERPFHQSHLDAFDGLDDDDADDLFAKLIAYACPVEILAERYRPWRTATPAQCIASVLGKFAPSGTEPEASSKSKKRKAGQTNDVREMSEEEPRKKKKKKKTSQSAFSSTASSSTASSSTASSSTASSSTAPPVNPAPSNAAPSNAVPANAPLAKAATIRGKWTDEEYQAIFEEMQRLQTAELAVSSKILTKDMKLYKELSARLMERPTPIYRTGLACKNFWIRFGKLRSKWDEKNGRHSNNLHGHSLQGILTQAEQAAKDKRMGKL